MMKIKHSTFSPNFKRAFTTKEKISYKNLISDARKELGIKDTSAIIFDFNVPSENGFNIGIGTSFADNMGNFTDFIQNMTGINSIQFGPQGKISCINTSPYSGTNFAFGDHIIDVKQYTKPEFFELLIDKDIQKYCNDYPGDKTQREYRTDYDYAVGTEDFVGVQERLFKRAYKNFGYLLSLYEEPAYRFKQSMQDYKDANKDWLERELIFAALTEEYGTDDYTQWYDIDRDLYSSAVSEQDRQARVAEIKKQNEDIIDFELFKQYSAYIQHNKTKAELNKKGIKVYGDCLLGFSPGEMWANKDCFKENLYYGASDPNCSETNGIQTWGFNALDYTKLGEIGKNGDISGLGKTGKLLYRKYRTFFERYDGLRIDAAWQFVTPFIYRENNGKYEHVKIPELNNSILNIIDIAAKDAKKYNPNNQSNIMLELSGLSSDKSRTLTKNQYPHLYTTEFAEFDEAPFGLIHRKGYQNGNFYVGVGNHDNKTLLEQSENTEKLKIQLNQIAKDYNIDFSQLNFNVPEYTNQTKEKKIKEIFRNAKFAEIFTSSKQFFTLPDMFGMSERINTSGKKANENWRVRIPGDFEKFYFSQLAKGFGLNIPKALENALKMKHSANNNLMKKLSEAANILRQEGPYSEQEANNAEQKGTLKNKFEYKA